MVALLQCTRFSLAYLYKVFVWLCRPGGVVTYFGHMCTMENHTCKNTLHNLTIEPEQNK